MAIDMNALRAKAMEKKTEKPPEFIPIDLNEGNVQAIFNRCLAKEGTPKENISKSILFSRTMRYNPRDELVINFDKKTLHANKQSIDYLYGQLMLSHQKTETLTIDKAFYNYQGKKWTQNKVHLLELLHLGSTNETDKISIFNAKTNTAEFNLTQIPTLSPKDPAFPAWWEAHKGEWED